MRALKNTLYRVSHSYIVLGVAGAVALMAAVFIRIDFRHTPELIPFDPRSATWGALAIVASVLIYDRQHRIPTAFAANGVPRAAYLLSRMLACYLLTALVYAVAAVASVLICGGTPDGEFFSALLRSLPAVLATTGFVLLLATFAVEMTAYLAVMALLIFVVWNGYGYNIAWIRAAFPPYMQASGEALWQVCAAWIFGAPAVGVAVERLRGLR